jgi:internalin A
MNIEEARQKIKEAKANNSILLMLDSSESDKERLSSDDLIELLPDILEIKLLTILTLRNNFLTDISFLKELKSITTLNLSNSLFFNAVLSLSELRSLTTLKLSHNNLKDVSFLSQLTRLNELDLSHNQLTNVDVISNLTCLKTLNLSVNNLSDVSFLRELTGLISLNLQTTNVSNYDFINYLTNLTSLYLGMNRLLSDNSLKAEYLQKLTKLYTIDVSFSNISKLDFILCLPSVKLLDVTNNNLNLPKYLKKIIEDKKPFFLDTNEINQIVRYYEQLEKQLEEGKDYIYEARVLIVGEPKSGKTTLTQKVFDNKKWNAEMKGEPSTQTIGIEIDHLLFPYYKDAAKQITAHFWDFGGQDIQYVLHQYFFTERSLYVLLADGRKELPNFNYWFEIIATLGRNCPVLVVLNENGGKPVKTFNINEYRDQFGNYLESIEERSVNFYDDSDGKFDKLKADIEHKTSNLKHIGSPLPKTWVDVRKELEKLKAEKSYIEKDEFLKVCERCNLTNKDYIAQVIDYLHDLGIALNYKNDANLRNKFILRPNWVIDALYVVLQDNKIETDRGMFEVDYVDSLWTKSGYNSTDCDILLGLMQKGKFEIAYKLKENKFIVPILLPYKPEVEYKLSNVNEIQTIIEYKFMPKGIVPRLIVRLHKSILSKEGQQVVWNKGVLLSHHNSIAEVVEREQSKQISIKVSGENAVHNKEMLTIIRNEIVGIHYEWFDNRLKYEELVPCVCDVCKHSDNKQFYRLSVLENALMKGKDVQCQTSFEPVNTRELVEGIYIVSVNKHEQRGDGNIIISNVDGSNISISTNKDINNSTIGNSIKQTNNSNELNKKLDEMFANLAEKQTNELQILVNELVAFVDKKIAESGNKSDEKVKEYQDIKVTSDWKAKLKVTIPIIPKFAGIEFEKEWKAGEEIKPETFIERIRSFLHLQKVNDKPLQLED